MCSAPGASRGRFSNPSWPCGLASAGTWRSGACTARLRSPMCGACPRATLGPPSLCPPPSRR
eukprot:8192176-Alexandrium_andersonii.AAC.1